MRVRFSPTSLMSKSERPTKFVCAGMGWTIHWVGRTNDCKAYTESATNSIYMDTSFDETTLRSVLLHELHHVIWYGYHLNPPKQYKYNHEEYQHGMACVEEYIVSTTSVALFELFESNPHLLDYIFPRKNK